VKDRKAKKTLKRKLVKRDKISDIFHKRFSIYMRLCKFGRIMCNVVDLSFWPKVMS